MKPNQILFFIAIILLTISCNTEIKKNPYKPRTIKEINLLKFDHKKFGMKSMNSIRSIEIIDSTAYFIAHGGKIYASYSNGNFLITPNDFFGEKIPNFRASAHSKNNLFTLSIESPAYLYKIMMDEKEGLKNPTLVYQEDGEKVFYDSMTFFDEQNGIAIGDPTEDCLSIILTEDAGNSWKKLPCNNLPKLIDGEALFAASNTNIAIIGNNAWIITGGKQSRVMHSSDKGKTWNITTTPLIYGTESTGGYSITFNDLKNGFICGGDYTNKKGNLKNKAITSDGGKTWELVADGKTPGYISCVQYVPKTEGKELFAVSTEGIYFSNNQGNSWVKVNDEGYFTIKFVDKNNAWLAGNGKIAKMKLE